MSVPLALNALYLLFTLFNLFFYLTNFMMAFAYIVTYMLLPLVFEVFWFRIIISGYACDYEANNVEFRVTRKGRPVMNILYKNAESVEYTPMRFLWVEQGFHVTIKMKSCSYSFDYVVPHAMLNHRESFPFEIISRKIGEQNAK
ncbi:MAG: hypothetical protein J1F03_06840 [Oscillospiraceae bacterium]|nr:hypothetical protein [Oscillospiraceae bacterium]